MTVTALRRFALAPALAALALLAACADDGTSPASPAVVSYAGTWVATSAAGQSLPARIHTETWTHEGQTMHDTVWVLADTLVLAADGKYQHRSRYEAHSNGALVQRSARGEHGEFELRGDSLRFESNYIQNVRFAGTAAPDISSLTIDQNVTWDATIPNTRYTFHRVP